MARGRTAAMIRQRQDSANRWGHAEPEPERRPAVLPYQGPRTIAERNAAMLDMLSSDQDARDAILGPTHRLLRR